MRGGRVWRYAARALGGAAVGFYGSGVTTGWCEGVSPAIAPDQLTKVAALQPPVTTLFTPQDDAGARRADLPDYKLSEIMGHNSRDKRVWVTFRDGVYDITDFIDGHPGGERILMAAGASIEPFWQIYQAHRESDITMKLLESMRIGNVDKEDRIKQLKQQAADPYATEPPRHPALAVLSPRPFNAETPPDMLVSSFYTPQDLFYVRNHMPVPVLEEEKFKVKVEGEGVKPTEFTLNELKEKFQHVKITATLQCAGNRRKEMNEAVRPTDGLAWGDGAISNALWTGVRLRDVLKHCGLTDDKAEELGLDHVQFEGSDEGLDKMPYGVSISSQRALAPREDVILAWEMNNEPLARDHGHPLRVVCPGIVAARSVKWVRKIKVSKEESQTVWMQKDYKNLGPNYKDRLAAAEAAKHAHAVREMPVQSAICVPENKEEIGEDDTTVALAGYAWSGGGRGIQRVDVSSDGGNSWSQATLAETTEHHDEHKSLDRKYGETHARHRSRSWGWTLWRAELPVAKEESQWKFCVKAVNTSNDTQPDTPKGIWNLRGLLNNSWHCIDVCREKDE
eukprot:Hpha_TRINITY_DN15652_c0_g2::TRINITY_DN15652_c0_g2_i1::g.98658::m.98658/K00387/SUOX; sulfite oxidase